MKRTRGKKASPAKSAYITKRVLKSAVGAAVRKASKNAMDSMGYVVKAENGWVIREDVSGKKTRIEKIDRAVKNKLALD